MAPTYVALFPLCYAAAFICMTATGGGDGISLTATTAGSTARLSIFPRTYVCMYECMYVHTVCMNECLYE